MASAWDLPPAGGGVGDRLGSNADDVSFLLTIMSKLPEMAKPIFSAIPLAEEPRRAPPQANATLQVALAVDDKLRKAREDQLRQPIVETEKRMDAKQRELTL